MKYGSTGSLAPITNAPFAVTHGQSAPFSTARSHSTATTFAPGPTGNTSNVWLKSGLLAKHLANAGKGYMKERTKQGAQDVLATADKFGGTGLQGAGGQFGTGAQSADGEWALGADKFRSGAEAPDWAAQQAEGVQLPFNPGDNVAALDTAENAAADSAMQCAAEGAAQNAATEAAANLGTDVAADVGTNLAQNTATEAATDAASSAAGAIPIAGTALNVGANLAQGKYGAAGGAAAGAALGSIIPGVGTALGGTIGGLLGSFL